MRFPIATAAPRPGLRAMFALLGCLVAVPTLSATPLPFQPELDREVSLHCQRVLTAGILNCESLACFPELRREVSAGLCTAHLGRAWFPAAAGFGAGAVDPRPAELPDVAALLWPEGVDPAAWSPWRSECCRHKEVTTSLEIAWGAGPAAEREFYGLLDRTIQTFATARAAAPRSLVGPWEDCASFHPSLFGARPGVACRLIGSYDTGGTDGDVYFTVWRILPPELSGPLLLPLPLPRLFAPKLRQDLEVDGADCEGSEWRKGMRVKGSHTVRCRRRGTSAITLRLRTTKGDCTEFLPELREPPWREGCGGDGDSAVLRAVPLSPEACR